MLNNKNFNVLDMQFKTIIASSLPASWDIFTDPYVGASPRAIGEINSKESILSQEFIGILKEEYLHRKSRTLIAKNGKHVAIGNKIDNNLYKMNVTTEIIQDTSSTPFTFTAQESAQSWDTWHRRLGHMGLSTLQKMLDKKLVDGFNVDTESMKFDCRACTEGKQTREPFGENSDYKTKPGEFNTY